MVKEAISELQRKGGEGGEELGGGGRGDDEGDGRGRRVGGDWDRYQDVLSVVKLCKKKSHFSNHI